MPHFRRPRKKGVAINMAPLVDMVFLLLIFFLLSSSFLNPTIPLELPSAWSMDKEARAEIYITVDHKERIFVNRDLVTLQTLGMKLEEKMAETGLAAVTFRGDRSIRYELFVKVSDIAKRSGAERIDIEHLVESEE